MFDLNPPEVVRAGRIMTMAPGDDILCDGAVLVDNGTIFDIGTYADISRTYPDTPVRDMGAGLMVPGLVNAHCHLELSGLRGAIEPGLGFAAWVRKLVRTLRASQTAQPGLDFRAVQEALEQMSGGGVCLVGDVATQNAQATAGILDDSGFFFVCFQEHIFFSPPGPGQDYVPDGMFEMGAFAAAGHGPYSTHPDLLRGAKAQCADMGLPFSLHLAEHEDETAMLLGRDNEYMNLLREAGIPLTDFRPPMKRPVEYARDLGLLDSSTLAVHCVTVDARDIASLRESGASVCLCPRSNEFITGGRAPWEALLAAGVNCCLGTDSLASNHDLDLWNEVRFMKERFQGGFTLQAAVAMLTKNGAAALGAGCLGELAPGKAARFAMVPADIEEMFAQ